MFGNKITDFVQQAGDATNPGILIAVNLQAYRIDQLTSVVLYNSTTKLYDSNPPGSVVSLDQLMSLLGAAVIPVVSAGQDGTTAYVLFDQTKFPYVDTTFISFNFLDNPIVGIAPSDALDLPMILSPLFNAHVLQEAYLLAGEEMPYEVGQSVGKQKKALSLQ